MEETLSGRSCSSTNSSNLSAGNNTKSEVKCGNNLNEEEVDGDSVFTGSGSNEPDHCGGGGNYPNFQNINDGIESSSNFGKNLEEMMMGLELEGVADLDGNYRPYFIPIQKMVLYETRNVS